MSNEPRFLSKSIGYTDSPVAGMYREPEALSASDQADVTRAAAERAAGDRRTDLERLLDAARREAEHVEALARHARKQVARLERRLAAG